MSLAFSTMLELGTAAPDFNLPDVVTGKTIALSTVADRKALLVLFICRHCPFVCRVQDEIARLGRDYQDSIGTVAISSNDADRFTQDSPGSLKEWAQALGFTFPVCFDASQSVAKAYTAACTPDPFLFDEKRLLVYRGQLDDSRPGNGKVPTGRDIRAAIEATLTGKPVAPVQRPSAGCDIKWKPGNAPAYFSAAHEAKR
jgi:peroxiredoxin